MATLRRLAYSVLQETVNRPEVFMANQYVDGYNISKLLKLIVTQTIKKRPRLIWQLLKTLDQALWPDLVHVLERDKMWVEMRDSAKRLAPELIDERNDSKYMHDLVIKGIYSTLRPYIDGGPCSEDRTKNLAEVVNKLTENQPVFFKAEAPWFNLGWFIPLGTLYLSALREKALEDISEEELQNESLNEEHNNTRSAVSAPSHLDLKKTIHKYVSAAGKIREKCLEWRMAQVTMDPITTHPKHGKGNYITTVQDSLRGISVTFTWGAAFTSIYNRGEAGARDKLQELEDWVTTTYTSQLDDFLAPTTVWKWLQLGKEIPTLTDNIMNCHGPFGSSLTEGTRYWDDSDLFIKHNYITKIILYGEHRVEGMQIYYGGTSRGLLGRASGTPRVLNLRSGEYVTSLAVWAHRSQPWISKLSLRKTRLDGNGSDSISAGGASLKPHFRRNPTFSFHGHNPDGIRKKYGTETSRLVWINGWHRDDDRGGYIDSLYFVFLRHECY